MPFLNPCHFCLQDFGGRVLLNRHRTHPGNRFYRTKPRCMTAEEMMARGWFMDRYGRWRDARMRKT
jgi:hypothetical protein